MTEAPVSVTEILSRAGSGRCHQCTAKSIPEGTDLLQVLFAAVSLRIVFAAELRVLVTLAGSLYAAQPFPIGNLWSATSDLQM
ncbi:MAG: hypothetical protein KDA96_15985 [Planctomycetaceae bacterium]|nr:hypothetical protein [Planctomycetaceae bacterium]